MHVAAAGLLFAAGAGLWGAPLPAQDPVRGEEAPRALEELRAERDRLAREIEELRARIEGEGGWWSFPSYKGYTTGKEYGPSYSPGGNAFGGVTWLGSNRARVHRVEKGDSLHGILEKYHGRVTDELLELARRLNPDLDARRLRPGQEIRIPARMWSPFESQQDSAKQDWATYVGERPSSIVSFGSETSRPAGGGARPTREPVLDLVTRAVELRGERDIARARLEEADTSGGSTRVAEVQVRTAERKLEVVRRLVEGELQAAKLELRHARTQMRGLDPDDPRRMRLEVDVQRLETRIETLKSAL